MPAREIPWNMDHSDSFSGGTGLPEISSQQLNVDSLRAGILGKGGVIVRGLVGPEQCAVLRDCIDRASTARRKNEATPEGPQDPWYVNPQAVKGQIVQYDDSLWAVNSPPTAARLVQLYRSLGLPDMLQSYFGEPATLSVRKWVLRHVAPNNGAESGWHQDGQFMGTDIRTVNLWLALSDCGEGASAPGIDIVADNTRKIYPTGTHGSPLEWTVGQGLVDELGEKFPVQRPRFAPGDAVFFDHFNLHRTGFGLQDSDYRYAVETWFFAASKAPAKQQPLLL